MSIHAGMKFFRIVKYIILIILVAFTILLNWGQGYLAKQDIVYSDRLVLIKVVMTWLIVPFTLVNSLHSTYAPGTITYYEQINPFLYRGVIRPVE